MSGLPKGWAIASIDDLTDPKAPICYGVLKPGDRDGASVPMVRVTDIRHDILSQAHLMLISRSLDEEFSRSRIRRGDVLLSIQGTIGRVAIVPDNLPAANISRTIARIRPALPELSRWLWAALRTPQMQEAMGKETGGSTRDSLNIGALREILIRLPPVAEQRRIVAKLDALTARTARARADLDRIPALAARYKLALLRTAMRGGLTESWREQAELEPASALVERTPAPQQGRGGREATTGIVPGQAALSVNDPGTSAPDGWAWTPLLRIARQETGHTPSRSVDSYWGGEVPWIGIRDAGAHHGRTIERTLQTITEEGLANSSARVLPARTVCLSRTASVGYVTIMARPMATSQDFATWTCSEALEPEFLMYALMAEGDDIRAFGEGSTHTTIYFPEIRALHICLPPLAEQQEIIRRVRAGLTEIDRLTAEAEAARRLLDRLDQAILAKAFRGELVPQDPADEPASVLLERIRAERAVAPKTSRGRRKAAA
ncbi:restriction endonuclease subunit S [Phenylobacterium sp.]|uniref:restriction endonuclease subunit S n=1 Tax=Phenylobacterium sp. TaxID=1871053 RepID=UPI002811FEB1|nr:restriction endonuclease subunit S [Phenylobacterium sp.]